MSSETTFDPFQVFEVSHRQCALTYVKVIRGRTITKGWAQDLVDTPDPYVILTLANSPHSWRKTSVKDNDVNPLWNETFTFWLDPTQEHTLEMSLMDANYTADEHLATRSFPLNPLPIGRKIETTIHFNETSKVDIEIWAEMNDKPDLRYSLTLCNEEKNFIEARKRKTHKAFKHHYGFASPRNYKEVPVVAVIGSGGGFRAMTAYSGVMSALSEMGVLDMAMYVGGLSGSAWYISQLYSHREWPNISPTEQRQEIRNNIDHSFLWLFKSHGLTFVKEVWKKRSRGEPVSFTDLFGHLVGYTLLKDRLDVKLSDQQLCVKDGQCPLPLYTCLHVKKSVSAMIFHEWMEFSPFEVGLPKYGTFIKTEKFSCKFFMGSIVREFPEPPLHFLQGIWGSAFCIQFKCLLQDDKNVNTAEMIRREREGFEEELRKDMAVYDMADSESSDEENVNEKGTHGEKTTGGLQRKRSKSTKLKQKSFWDSMLTKMLESKWFQSIELRAAQVFNYMRGLALNNVYPFSPFTQTKEEDENNRETFGAIFDLHPTNIKKLYVVDSGLTFNSPFPVVLRPQREVDIILSFDFSARPTDDTPPFKELLLAAKWAELNKVPFPPIDPTVVEREGLKECYVFKHPWDPNCPIVLHFCLININFKREVSPGVPRTTQEELNFGNFSIFDDSNHPYSTFKFTYTHLEFDRLSKLMEYNTLLCKDIIFDNIGTCIKRRKRFSIRRPCKKQDILRLSLNSKTKMEKLIEYISMAESVSNVVDDNTEEQKIEETIVVQRKNEQTSSHSRSRPISTPVHSLELKHESTASNQNQHIITSGSLYREHLEVRRVFSHGMSQVDEVDEVDDSSSSNVYTNPNTNASPTANKKSTLTRSRVVTPANKPIQLLTSPNSVVQKSNISYSNGSQTSNNHNTNKTQTVSPIPSPRLGKEACQNLENQNPAVQLNKSSIVNDKNHDHPSKSTPSRNLPPSGTDYKNGHSSRKNILNKSGDSKMSGINNSVEDWIDAADRVTDL